MSTQTRLRSRSRRKVTVSAAATPSNQDPWRSSTATRHGRHRSANSSIRRRAPALRTSHGGNCNNTAPSRSAAASGSSAARNRLHSSSYDASGRSRRRIRDGPVAGRRSLGSTCTGVGWPVKRLNALTSKVKPGGVAAAHPLVVSGTGTA